MRKLALLLLFIPGVVFALEPRATPASNPGAQDAGESNRAGETANCVIADPTSTPLNIRTAPNGKIVGTIANGERARILDQTTDRTGDQWVYISDSTSQPLGWVFRRYIVCK
jgi:hypothetical protein